MINRENTKVKVFVNARAANERLAKKCATKTFIAHFLAKRTLEKRSVEFRPISDYHHGSPWPFSVVVSRVYSSPQSLHATRHLVFASTEVKASIIAPGSVPAKGPEGVDNSLAAGCCCCCCCCSATG